MERKWKKTPVKRDRGEHTKYGLYKTIDLNLVDGRTRMGRVIGTLRDHLRAYVGRSTPASELLIHRIIYKAIRLSRYESNMMGNPADGEAAHYLPMANSLRADLQVLAQMTGQAKPPDLQEYLEMKYRGSNLSTSKE